ncbi:endoglucanase [Methanobrevibacter sp.]
MSSDRDKLLAIMDSLDADYKSGKLSAEKYSYFRSKYEDKLNAIDARDATKRIRSMQGKSLSKPSNEKRSKKLTSNKKKDNRQDLVQKYIINPKKDDVKYNKPKKQPMDSGTFKLLLLLVLVLGFTVGVGYGVFNLDFNSISNAQSVAIVQDTAFPEFTQDIVENTTVNDTYTTDYTDYNQSSDYQVETTTEQQTQDQSSYDYGIGSDDNQYGQSSEIETTTG